MARIRRRLIAGNWKMHGRLKPAVAEMRRLAALVRRAGRSRCDIVICPPASLLVPLRATLAAAGGLRRIALGDQDCHSADAGAHPRDITAPMLADTGARFVILGHSERRADHAETDALVRAKVQAAHRAGLIAIVCVGENLAEREAGAAYRVVGRALSRSLPASGVTAANIVIAYEPVWAIGTGRSAESGDIARMHGHIRRRLGRLGPGLEACRILYGGSVKPANAAEILSLADVDGALVGGASLKIAEFRPIIEAAWAIE